MRRIGIIFFCVLGIMLIHNISFAEAEMRVIADKQVVEKDEEVSVKIEISNTQIAAFSLEVYWDIEKLDFVKGPEKSNVLNNKILYMWVSDSGKNNSNIETEEFVFKGISEGVANFVVVGEFYNEDGNVVEIDNNSLELQIGKKEVFITQQIEETIVEPDVEVASNNANLKIMRLSHEGISPEFNKNIKEYYFIADNSINSLNVTAVPENKNASVSTIGNDNLKIGKNVIEIHVLSEDKTNEEIYKIYVTKTQNIELANANLETLAIRDVFLNPSFDPNITKYTVEIPNNKDKIDILAIGQSEKSEVTIVGNDEMKTGDNIVKINVLAEDKITNKSYEILVKRRNEQEQKNYEEEQQIQVEKLSAILEETEKEENVSRLAQKKNNLVVIIIIPILVIVVIVAIVYIKNKKSSN